MEGTSLTDMGNHSKLRMPVSRDLRARLMGRGAEAMGPGSRQKESRRRRQGRTESGCVTMDK
ncbi:hypothetical protein D7X48_19885 [bacterium D16-50]|nr:hypothetical protein D7X48_19885 [bacterium D16-50]